jgi:putative flippase GtrA
VLFKFEIFRFLFVGVVNTAFSFGVYSMLLFLGMKYFLANGVALVAGILFSFVMQGRFVFRNTQTRLLGRFVFGWIIIYFANIGFIRAMLQYGLNPYVAGALAIPPITLVSYFMQKYFVFRTKG